MDVKQLYYFLEVEKWGSFTKASKELKIAQPAISKAIQNLEKELELPLFIREKRYIRLTMEGELLKKHADVLLQNIHQAKKELREVKEGIRGTVKIGIPSMVGSYYFPEKLAWFKEIYPQLDIELYEAGTTVIEQAILDGALEIGTVVQNDVSPELEVHPFLKEQLMIVVPPSHRFAVRTSVGLTELAAEPLILFKEGYYQRKIIEQASQLSSSPVQIAFETNQISLAKSLAARGFGVTVFLHMVVRPDENLIAIPFDPPIHLTLGLAHKKGHPPSTANASFLSFLKSIEEYPMD
ncbi:DNA-binding transcriptional LysR family regulator [Salibacterium salarium]|uniref:LysR family transcriptional regulator n=1 Tax=Salibacterium salarium TaxID=284579 RepID=UPI00278691FD|nr:LysR family transcriptional regulator [Salibacterium salarium]MDQ0298947.1 DNA-binding transcriptional LysR family regulator [Salibacterium salarium]